MFRSVSDYYRAVLDRLSREIRETPDDTVRVRDADGWRDDLVEEHGLEPLEADLEAIAMMETRYNGHPAIAVLVPVAFSRSFDRVAKECLTGDEQWMGFDYSAFFSLSRPYTIGLPLIYRRGPELPGEIEAAKRRVAAYIRSVNAAIWRENETFPDRVSEYIRGRVWEVEDKDKNLAALATRAGIRLVTRGDPLRVVPTAVKVKKTIAPVLTSRSRPTEQPPPILERDKFNGIMELLDNQCRAFERTPTVFQRMGEEALRDILLSSLNAVFEGEATGEAFSVLGKTDVHLRISKGELFAAECKIWEGEESLAKVVAQLRDRLTWRDGFGVAIVFSRNKRFSDVLRSVEMMLPALAGAVSGPPTRVEPNHFVVRFTLPGDEATQVEIHAIVYNLFTVRPARRTSS